MSKNEPMESPTLSGWCSVWRIGCAFCVGRDGCCGTEYGCGVLVKCSYLCGLANLSIIPFAE